MKHEEFFDYVAGLPIGTPLERLVRGKEWKPAILLDIWYGPNDKPVGIYVRHFTEPARSSRRSGTTLFICDDMEKFQRVVRLPFTPSKSTRLTANVFADWLHENGFHEAANALRDAFPLVEQTPDSSSVALWKPNGENPTPKEA